MHLNDSSRNVIGILCIFCPTGVCCERRGDRSDGETPALGLYWDFGDSSEFDSQLSSLMVLVAILRSLCKSLLTPMSIFRSDWYILTDLGPSFSLLSFFSAFALIDSSRAYKFSIKTRSSCGESRFPRWFFESYDPDCFWDESWSPFRVLSSRG